MQPPPDPRPMVASVVLLAGPSGCGKTHVAEGSGLPIVALDDFYRDGSDPGMPRTASGSVDWEHPSSWDADAAVAALAEICRADRIEVPTYSFGEDRVVGHRTIERDGSPIVIAEGIFAAELVHRLRRDELLAGAFLIRQNRWVTFVRRLMRDLREGRKPPWYLVRQGWAKTRSEPAVVARQARQGARPATKAEARARLAGLANRSPGTPNQDPGPARRKARAA